MQQLKLKIGLIGAVHPNMPGDDVGLFRQVSEAMDKRREIDGYELYVVTDPLRSEEDGKKAKDRMIEEDVDLVLIFNASLPYGRCILPFADVKIPIGIWSVPEPATGGILQLNSFCGLNMLGSILQNYFVDEDIKYKWFYGMPDSEMFRERFEITLRALRAIKTLKTTRIGQIGDLADGFENLHVDERVLYKRFGTTLQARHTVEDLVLRAESYSVSELENYLIDISGESRREGSSVSKKDLEKFARLNKAFDDFASYHNYNALAISCWSKFQEVYDIAVCGAMSRLNNNGIVAPCEADVTSAVTMLMLNAMNGDKASLNDMVALDESDGSLNLWHCGVAPRCWADSCGVKWDAHFNIGEYSQKEWKGRGVVADMQFKPGPVTAVAVSEKFDRFFILTGEMMEGKKGYAGSSGWVDNLKINGSPATIPELINTISIGRVNHHYSATYGHLDGEINEFVYWTDMEVLDKVAYHPYMQKFI
jgi:L-fucose isomerase-like protein